MDLHRTLFELVGGLVGQRGTDDLARGLLTRVVDATSAERGFVVIAHNGAFEPRFDVRFDRDQVSPAERRFSRSVVRHAIEERALVHSKNVLDDTRFRDAKSVALGGARAALVAPLSEAEVVYGAIYLDRPMADGGFPDEIVALVAALAPAAAVIVRQALEHEAVRRRVEGLERDLLARHDFPGISTRDPGMLRVLEMVAQVAETNATVLVRGETGTGKELVARAIHVNSHRKSKPFVVLNAAALPGTVLEGELFGHVKGAFTGADRNRPGRIASANGGTLFLDEVAEIPLDIQAKLLRFVQFGEIQRLGSDDVDKVDVRLVAATHQDLVSLVQKRRFREDLYYRLKVVELTLPPLRQRAGDVPVLAAALLRQHAAGASKRFSPEALRLLERHAFPGNVRELAHVIERALVFATGDVLGPELLPDEIRGASAGSPAASAGSPRFSAFTGEELDAVRDDAVAAIEREFLRGLLAEAGGNVSAAARRAGMHRSYLQKLLARHPTLDLGAKDE
jgi:transcriptional regulator with GAF, ATPase, and Fis domain